jgi:nicotinate-nucleotide adenylyltransferase
MNIAILGGSFDPPHKGHAAIAEKLLKEKYFDEIWLIPCYHHPFIKKLSSPDKRLKMAKHLENGKIKISDFEIKKGTTSYSIDTLIFFAKKHPQHKFSWIIGTDQIEDFTKWKDWKKIINDFKLVIVPRTGFKKAKKILKNIYNQISSPNHIVFIDKGVFPPIRISSTMIRKKIKQNKSTSGFLPTGIEKYLKKTKLYQ